MEKEYTPPEKVKELAKVGDKRPVFTPIPVFKLAKMPEVKTKIKPEYPAQLRKDEIEGEVLLKVSINKLGEIVDAKVVASDHELFSKAALAAIRLWKFKPALLANGEAVDSVVDIPVIFQLEF
jgi:TonB family protein